MKKILLSVLLCTVVLAGCGVFEDDAFNRYGTTGGNMYSGFTADNSDNSEESENMDEDFEPSASAQEVVEIYLENYNTWKPEFEYMPNGYGYCLVDLDFDGVCELIVSVVNGSGYFSTNKYYKVNVEERSLEAISAGDYEENDNGYDWYAMNNDVKLLRNVNDNSMFYYCSDYVRAGYGEYDMIYGKVCLADGAIYTDAVFHEYHSERDENPANHTHSYSIIENDTLVDVDEVTYLEKQEEFFRQNVDMGLTWTCIEGMEYDEADEDTRREMFFDAYYSFSHS